MAKLFSKKCNVDVHLLYDQKLYVLYPGSAFLSEETPNMPTSTTVTGRLLLCMSDKTRTYKSISLTHEIRYTARIGSRMPPVQVELD